MPWDWGNVIYVWTTLYLTCKLLLHLPPHFLSFKILWKQTPQTVVPGTETLAMYLLRLLWLEVRHLLHRWVFSVSQRIDGFGMWVVWRPGQSLGVLLLYLRPWRVHYPALLGVLVHPVSIDFITSNSRAKKKYFLNNFLSLVLINKLLKKQLKFN